MATKSVLTTAINGFITALITQSKVRSAYLELINALFQTTTIQTLTTGSNVFWHTIRYKKIGNIVYVDGWIENKYASLQTGVVMVTIPDSLFYAKTGQDTIMYGVASNVGVGSNIMMSFAASSIAVVGGIASGQRIYFNGHYQTND